MAQLDSSNEDVKSELPVAHSKSLENTSDSDRTEKEIDRIIAETFMLTPGCSEAVSSVLDSVVNAGNSGTHGEFEDEDPETLSMRLNLIESLQNKLKSVEKEEGEVTDEDALSGGLSPEEPPKVTTSNKTHHDTSSRKRSYRSGDSKSREKRRSSEKRTYRTNESSKHRSTPRAYINVGKSSKSRETDRKTRASYSTRSRRSRKSEHDITKGKSESAKAVTELSITLPVEQSSSKNSGVVVTTARDQPRLSSERVVDTSKSHTGGENRCIKRVGDSGPNLSITVNAFSDAARPVSDRSHLHDSGYSSQSCSSIPRPPPRVSHRTVLGEGPDEDTDIPLPPPPVPPRTMTVSPPVRQDFVLLPPPPAPPIFPQAMEKSGTCSPSSITVQVREGGGRVAQMSSSSRTKDTGRHPEKMRSPEQPPPPPPLDRYPDNYEDVGMDVESSRSSLVSDLDHEDEANSPPRHRLISDADEEQLRQMLLNQVILHRKRLAESTTQSSDVSLFDGPGDDNTQNQSRCSNEEMPHREAPAKEGEPTDLSSTPAPDIKINGLSSLKKDSFRLYEPPCKRKKDNAIASEEFYSLKSPPCSTLTALEAQLKEHQSELDILDSKIMEHMTTFDTSLHRRAELRKQLAELDADIDAERVGCRLLMQRRNTIRRAVERCEELKLDLLLENEWQPSNGTETQNSEEISPIEDAHTSFHIGESLSRSYSEAVDRPSDEIVEPEQPEPHVEEQMRLKLLARMRKDLSASTSQDKDKEGRIAPENAEESCSQSTQTIDSEEEAVLPLYRLDSFPERLKRFVGIPPDMSVMPTDCPLEALGKKCSDVFCQSKHSIDEELSVDDVLGMMIAYAPGLVDSVTDADLTRQVDALRARRLPDERFGVFARRLLDGLPLDKRPKATEEVQDNNEGRGQVTA